MVYHTTDNSAYLDNQMENKQRDAEDSVSLLVQAVLIL